MTRYLFTTLPSNDLGLLTRSLPVATELAQQGQEIIFCSPGESPSRLIASAGFENPLPKHPLFYLLAAKPGVRSLLRVVKAGQQDFGGLVNFLGQLIQIVPIKFAPLTSEMWNMDHFAALSGMLNENLVRASSEALMRLMEDLQADAIVDFCNPFACIAAKALQKPLITITQADMHPASQGFIWWKTPPANLPPPVPVLNSVLAAYGLCPINKTETLLIGDLTLVVGIPETDPLPDRADVTYIGSLLWQRPGAQLPKRGYAGDMGVLWKPALCIGHQESSGFRSGDSGV